jgi:hypothetical protein
MFCVFLIKALLVVIFVPKMAVRRFGNAYQGSRNYICKMSYERLTIVLKMEEILDFKDSF